MSEIHGLSIRELKEALDRQELTSQEVTRAFLDRIREKEEKIHAFLTVDSEGALAQAEAVDSRRKVGERGGRILEGVPVAVKDNIVTKGLRTTCGSRILENYVPPYDATVVEKLREAGAVVLGKTNCDEFAMGSTTENSAYFPTHNPWDLERVPGGSSGGSAAAVAARQVPGSLGSDTGGSIRQPAAFCGVVGLKPTYGRVSRYGLVAFASSLDQIGPMANSVEDVALLLQATAGPDPRDSTASAQPPGDYLQELGQEVKGLRVGIPREWFGSGLQASIKQSVSEAVRKLEGLGCSIEEVVLPHSQYAISTYYIIAPAEASSNLARYDGVKYGHRSSHHEDLEGMFRNTRSEGFGEEVKRRIMIGTYVLSSGYYDSYFLKAAKVRTLLKKDFIDVFQKVDVVVGPTTPSLPFGIGEKRSDPLEIYLMDIFTVTANLAGIPGLALPCGLSPEGLPIGLQILAPHFQEGRLLRIAHALEQELTFDSQPEL